MKLYGKIWFQSKGKKGGQWFLELEPHVAIRFKDIFRKADKSQVGRLAVSHSNPTCKDLKWFIDRYPLDISEADKYLLDMSAEDFDKQQAEIESLFIPEVKFAAYQMAKQPRDYQKLAIEVLLKNKALLCADDVGLGKAQPVSCNILTPDGFRPIGSIVTGDLVVGRDGTPVKVTGTFPQGKLPVFKIIFSDGSQTRCCADHLWNVQTDNQAIRTPDQFTTVSTKQLLEYSNLRNLRIPIVQPVHFFEQPPIDPYLMGALLGGGSFRNNHISLTNNDLDEITKQTQLIDRHRWVIKPHLNKATTAFLQAEDKYQNHYIALLRVWNLYNKLSHEKFVPRVFLRAPIKDRIALLRGLMDTDGYVAKDGTLQFTTVSPQLSADMTDLIQSLGGVSRVTTKIPTYRDQYDKPRQERLAYTHTINLPIQICPVTLARKVARLKTTQKYPPYRKIISIDPCGTEESVCIKVASEDQLYVTENYIVTHNTIVGIGGIVAAGEYPAMVVCQTHLPGQWKEKFEEFAPQVRAHIIKSRRAYDLPEADVYLMPYSRLIGWTDVIAKGSFKTVVYDECQELRRSESGKYQTAKVLTDKANRVLGLSATPIYNYGAEIYCVMNIIRQDCLGTWDEFLREWCVRDYWGPKEKSKVKDPKALGTYLRESYLMLRRTRKDAARELPPINRVVHHVEYDEDIAEKAQVELEQIAARVVSGQFTERGQAARELDSRARMMTGVAKAVGVANYVKILLENGEKVLLVGWHREVYDTWARELAEYNPVMYTGSESPNQKEKAKQAFMREVALGNPTATMDKEGERATNLMIMSLRSGVGLDGLQAVCSLVVFGELDWSPGVHEQVIGRLHRDGQNQNVTALYLVTDNGTDPLMVDILGLKASQAHGIVNPGSEVEFVASDDERIKKLAANILARRKS